ncbi:MAG: sugar transferase [Lachnospiraceae bacterium]|nr:sugar transferase [Lachnospiraceae bacterium]
MYREEKKSWLKHLDFTILDIIALEAALMVAFAWRFNGGWLFSNDFYERIALLLLLVDIFVVFFMEAYTGILRRNKYQELRSTIYHCAAVFGGVLVYLYAAKQSAIYSRKLLFVFLGLSIVFSYSMRVLWKRVIRQWMLKDRNKAAMIIVTELAGAEECIREIALDKYTDFKVNGVVIVDEDLVGQDILGVPVVATADSFLEYVKVNVIDEVFINANTRQSSEALASDLIELGITVHIGLFKTDKRLMNQKTDNFGDYVVLTTSMHIASARQLFLKRIMDILGGVVGMLFCVIFFIIFAPIIKLQSPGPVFYKSVRIGRNGRRFVFYKFRSMYVGADKMQEKLQQENEMQGNMFKMDNDPRIIPIGHFMRKYSIDEFPQFWNVLKGDMSLVGTRPPTEAEFEQYEAHHKARLGFKPGLTGMWQANGRNDITDFEEVVALDTQYIANWTIGLDIQILFKTIGVVLSGKGSK